ncbi:hypothetical protein GQ53DRAFT_759818 [Thozetella sp. PMI_491]|nr:hypothetical protein GQ53DRAFT_759818 [Thozetella sp. PMI_491]
MEEMETGCSVQSAELPEGYNKEQEKTLRKRKKIDCSEEQRWRDMYMVLFPDDGEDMIPTPCKLSLRWTSIADADDGKTTTTNRIPIGRDGGMMNLTNMSSTFGANCHDSYGGA